MTATIKPWPVLSSQKEIETRIFTLRTDTARNPRNGAEHPFHVLESPDWVNIIALTPAQKIVLIRQYRFGTQEVSLEIPGGLIDPGETPRDAAVRELREETGFAPPSPERIREIGRVRPNPAFLDNTCHTFLIEDVAPLGQTRLEGGEDISVEVRPVGELPTLISQGLIDHALVLNAFFWFLMPRLRPPAEA